MRNVDKVVTSVWGARRGMSMGEEVWMYRSVDGCGRMHTATLSAWDAVQPACGGEGIQGKATDSGTASITMAGRRVQEETARAMFR